MRRTLAHLLLALLLLASVQELALRWVFPVPEAPGFGRENYAPLEPGSARRSLAHAAFTWTSDPDGFSFDHRLNLYGFRDREWRLAPTDGWTRLAFVGDSFVEGFSTSEKTTLPAVFARRAVQAGLAVETLNFGIGGATLLTYLDLLRDVAPLFAPDDVLLVLYANDLVPVRLEPEPRERSREPQRASTWTPRLVHVLRERSLGRPVPRRWHTEPFGFLPAVPDPRNRFSREADSSALASYVAPEIARAMREGRFNPALARYYPWARKALVEPVDLTPYLRRVADVVQGHGARLLVVYLPTKSQVTDRYLPYQQEYSPAGSAVSLMGEKFQVHARWLARSCTAVELPFLDLTPMLRELEASGPELFWRYDDHLRSRGYRAVAERLLEWWRKQVH